jgi:hypothetical protein
VEVDSEVLFKAVKGSGMGFYISWNTIKKIREFRRFQRMFRRSGGIGHQLFTSNKLITFSFLLYI